MNLDQAEPTDVHEQVAAEIRRAFESPANQVPRSQRWQPRAGAVIVIARTWLVLLSTVALAACGGTSGRSQSRSPLRSVAVGRLPNGEGFGIWVRGDRVRGRERVRVIAMIVPAAPSLEGIRRELNSGRYASAEMNLDQLTPPDDLVGLVGCTDHPVVLLYGLSYGFASATFNADGHGRALNIVQLPADLGVKAGGIAWGVLTHGATLKMTDNTGEVFYSHKYPAPPTYGRCRRGPETVRYASS